MSRILYYVHFQQVLMNRQGSMFLFSLLSFSQRTEGSLAYKFAEVDRECGRHQATFEVASCGKEYNSKNKAKL
jgi:hypothetical protein